MPHHYNSSLQYEKDWHPIADKFYLSKWSNAELIRYKNDSKVDLEFQRKDIDLSLKNDDKIIHISEKFRKDDFGDLLIELYSKYPHKKGWMENSEANFITYFCPKTVYIVNKKDLLSWFDSERILESLTTDLESFHQSSIQKSSRKNLVFNSISDIKININLIQAYNKTSDAEWHTISIAIKWNDLINLGLKVWTYELY